MRDPSGWRKSTSTGQRESGPRRESDEPIVPVKPAKAGGGKGLWFWVLSKKGRIRRLGNLETPTTIRSLQRKLYRKAKNEPGYRGEEHDGSPTTSCMVSTGLSVWTNSSQPGVRTLAVNPVRELDAANPHVQFDEREMETGLPFAGTAPSLDSTCVMGSCTIPVGASPTRGTVDPSR